MNAWEKRKLGDMAKKVVEKNKSGEFKEVLTNSAENGIISQRDFFDKDIANKKSLNGYYVVRPDDFVYNPRISNSAPVGPIKRNRLNRTGIMSPLYFVFRVHNVNHGFLEQYFSANVWHHFMTQNGDTGARSDRFAIKDSVFVTMPILIPSVAEQQQIASSLQALDGLIAATQGKLDQLEMVKKALLQHLFDQSMRFKGYSDPWEKRKLGNFVEEFVEKTTAQNQYPVLTSSQKYGIVLQSDYFSNRQITTNQNIGYFVLPRNYFTYRSRSDNGIFKFNRNEIVYKGIISYFYPVFKIKKGNGDFFLELLNYSIKKQVDLESVGTGQRVLSFKKFKNISARVPEITEQEMIGQLCKKLRDLIAATQSKLSSLKSLKKALLQGLFI